MKYVQFTFNLDEEYDTDDEVVVREIVAGKLKKAAEEVIKGGTPDECGASHTHENGNDWFLQID